MSLYTLDQIEEMSWEALDMELPAIKEHLAKLRLIELEVAPAMDRVEMLRTMCASAALPDDGYCLETASDQLTVFVSDNLAPSIRETERCLKRANELLDHYESETWADRMRRAV